VRPAFNFRSYSRMRSNSYPKSRCAPSRVSEKASATSKTTLRVGCSLVRKRLESRFFVRISRLSCARSSFSLEGEISRNNPRRWISASAICSRGTELYKMSSLLERSQHGSRQKNNKSGDTSVSLLANSKRAINGFQDICSESYKATTLLYSLLTALRMKTLRNDTHLRRLYSPTARGRCLRMSRGGKLFSFEQHCDRRFT
jgi:hypothetical protein